MAAANGGPVDGVLRGLADARTGAPRRAQADALHTQALHTEALHTDGGARGVRARACAGSRT